MTINPNSFWCDECRSWTRIAASKTDTSTPRCSQCAEPYKCDECGYEIDMAGNCQRAGGHHVPEDLLEVEALPIDSFASLRDFYDRRGGSGSGELDCGVWWRSVFDVWRITVVNRTGDVFAVAASSGVVLLLAQLKHERDSLGFSVLDPYPKGSSYATMREIEQSSEWYEHMRSEDADTLVWALRTLRSSVKAHAA